MRTWAFQCLELDPGCRTFFIFRRRAAAQAVQLFELTALQARKLGLILADGDVGQLDLAFELVVDQLEDDVAGLDGVARLQAGPMMRP